MSHIIDRRKNIKGKSTANRRKFIKRVEGQIKRAIPDVVTDQSIKEITSGRGKVKVPIKGIKEPKFVHDPEKGKKKYVVPGNKEFVEGDKIPKPLEEGPGGRKGSKELGTSEDEFVIELSRDEFLKYFFAELELPNLVKKYFENVINWKLRRAGYTMTGNQARLNVKKSFKQSVARRIGVTGSLQKKLKALEEDLKKARSKKKKSELDIKIKDLKKKLDNLPFLDNIDLRFNNFVKEPVPITSAVMFCIMDVSASMGIHEKDIAKRFFTLLYIFLTKTYENIDIVFIRHHTEAKEVTEEEFFESRETGGTIVKPSLELMNKIIQERYGNSRWNIYAAQASDGDTWGGDDAEECCQILKRKILPNLQYMAYIEINRYGEDSELWSAYCNLKESNFAKRKLFNLSEIWPVFRDLFKRKNKDLSQK